MSAQVIDLTSRLAQPKPTVSCRACRPGFTCHPHRIAALSRRLRIASDLDAGTLLMPRQTFADVLDEVLNVLDQITDEVLPTEERGIQ